MTGRIGRVALAAATRARLADRGAIERRRRVEIDRAIEIRPVLVDVIAADEQALDHFALGADRDHLALRVHELIGIVRRDQIEVQAVARKLRSVEVRFAGANRDVARRQLRRRQRLRIELQRQARPGQAGRESELARRRRVGGVAVEAAGQRARDRVGADLRVVETVAAANRSARVAAGMPAEADARREVLRRIRQRLPVVAQPEIERQVVA